MEMLSEIRSRSSVRVFAPIALEKAQIQRVVDAGRLAPSAKNRQAWRFVSVQNAETRSRLQRACYGQEYVGDAPCIICLCTTNVDYKMPNGQLSYPVDIGIASAFMMLQVEHEGLGSCAVSTFDEEEVKAILTVPHSMRVVLLLLIGHPAERPAEPTPRHPIARVHSEEHW